MNIFKLLLRRVLRDVNITLDKYQRFKICQPRMKFVILVQTQFHLTYDRA